MDFSLEYSTSIAFLELDWFCETSTSLINHSYKSNQFHLHPQYLNGKDDIIENLIAFLPNFVVF